MIEMGIRNLMLFFKDKSAVFLSFLAEFIVTGLYILFMRDNLITSFSYVEEVELIMDIWMISGLLGITSVTTTMGSYGTMVEDKMKKIDRDFRTMPVGKASLTGGYMFSAIVVGIVMSFLVLVLSEIYVFHRYGMSLAAGRLLHVYGIILLSAVSNSALVLFFVSFLKSSNALAACCTILGALIGFLTGIYLPMGNLPPKVQLVVIGFPVSHSVVLFRHALTEPFVMSSFGGRETEEVLEFMEYMGIQYVWEGNVVSARASMVFLLASAAVFAGVSITKFYNKGIY